MVCICDIYTFTTEIVKFNFPNQVDSVLIQGDSTDTVKGGNGFKKVESPTDLKRYDSLLKI